MRALKVLTMAMLAMLVASPMLAQDADRSVAGGVKVDGWKARVDRRAASQGKTANDSHFRMEGNAFRISVGPAGNFWNPSHHAHGNYEVSATFQEHAMRASHPHSYGIFIGGADLESDTETLMYCIAYGNGTYSIKTFHGADVQTLVNMEASSALVKANEAGEATNTIGWRVQNGNASCVINGTVVKTFPASDVVTAARLKSLDGNYGIRVSHNLELTVSNYRMVSR